MLNEIQVIPGQNNCVIVSTGYPQMNQIKNMDKKNIPIAPAPTKMTNYQQMNITNDLMRCRKKANYKQGPYAVHQSASIIRRNARERNRVKQVNDGFAALRRHLPPSVVAALSNKHNATRGASKKLSKVDTLRMVVEYIRYLQQLLEESEESMESCSRSENQENHIYYTSTPIAMDASQRLDHGYLLDQTPPTSETSSSPAPSFSSDVSSGYPMNAYYPIEKYEGHETLNPMDEELLDVIAWWQQK